MEEPIGGMPDFDPDGPPCMPYPNSILNLGGFRWLGMDGRLLTVPVGYDDLVASLVLTAEKTDEDLQSVVARIYGCHGVDLNSRTLAYWEDAAARGGHVLQDLIQ